jgi:hypothetical protein
VLSVQWGGIRVAARFEIPPLLPIAMGRITDPGLTEDTANREILTEIVKIEFNSIFRDDNNSVNEKSQVPIVLFFRNKSCNQIERAFNHHRKFQHFARHCDKKTV